MLLVLKTWQYFNLWKMLERHYMWHKSEAHARKTVTVSVWLAANPTGCVSVCVPSCRSLSTSLKAEHLCLHLFMVVFSRVASWHSVPALNQQCKMCYRRVYWNTILHHPNHLSGIWVSHKIIIKKSLVGVNNTKIIAKILHGPCLWCHNF